MDRIVHNPSEPPTANMFSALVQPPEARVVGLCVSKESANTRTRRFSCGAVPQLNAQKTVLVRVLPTAHVTVSGFGRASSGTCQRQQTRIRHGQQHSARVWLAVGAIVWVDHCRD